jgi:predicted amidohydrolase YtcJ
MRQIFTGGQAWSPGLGLFQGVLVEDGRIIAIGPDALNQSADEVVDLGNSFLMPSFGDGHAHPIFAGREAAGPKVNGLQSVKEIQEAVRIFAQANPETPWIIGGAYEAAIISGGDFDTHWLDEVVSDRPVVLHAVDHHTIWVNSKALEIAGITSATTDPAGGSIARRADGSPKGTLREPEAFALILDHSPKNTIESDVRAIKYACQQFLKSGVTYANDSWLEKGMAEAYLAAVKSGDLAIDMNISFLASPGEWRTALLNIEKLTAEFEPYASQVNARSVKFLGDGALSSGTAALLEPYLDQPGFSGLKIWDDAELFEAVTEFDKRGYQIHIHAIGDAAIRQALDAFEYMQAKNPARDRRPVLVHAQLIDSTDLPRVSKLGVIANMQPLWMYLDPMNKELILPRIGSERNNRQYQLRTLVNSGATVAFGSDWPVTSEVPLEAIHIPVHRTLNSDGEPWSPEEAISIEESLTFYTASVAYQNFRERDLGKLEPGYKSDFIILDKSPLFHSDAKIIAVYKNGELVNAYKSWQQN